MMRRRPSPVSEARTFERHRPLLFSIAYRMLGSAMDAKDVVQEAYLRWQGRKGEVRSPKAYLCTAVTRLSINRLRSGASSTWVLGSPQLRRRGARWRRTESILRRSQRAPGSERSRREA
jgi:RNA polymerase sigma-70 factor (ECF subfamily)